MVYGAGVQGSFLAHVLDDAGHDVKILARGKRAKQLKENGVVIRHYFQRKTSINRIEVVEELKKNDLYDMIFVTMKYNDFQTVLPMIAQNISENVVLVGNNVTASEMQEYIIRHSDTKKNIVFGFQISGGIKTDDKTVAIRFDAGEMKVGSLTGDIPFKAVIEKAFEHTKYKVKFESNIDAWLKNHIPVILAMNFATYIKDNDFVAVARDNKLIKEAVASMSECYDLLEVLGYEMIPQKQADFIRKHKRTLFWFLKIYHRLPLANFVAGSFEEVKKLCDDFYEMKKGLDVPMLNLESLMRKAYEKYKEAEG